LRIREAAEREVVHDEQADFGQALEQAIVGALGTSLHEEGKECRHAQILHAEPRAAGVEAKGLSNKTLARARGADNEHRFMGFDPAVLCEFEDLIFAQAPRAYCPTIESKRIKPLRDDSS